MYIRFITEYINERDKQSTGVFQALGYLVRSNQTFDYHKEQLEEIRLWFNKNLEIPDKFHKSSNKHANNIALSWFKHTATEHLQRMYDLIPIYENYGIQVEVIKIEKPGYIIYEDEYQVATLPFNKDRKRVV